MLVDEKTLGALDFFPILAQLERHCASDRGRGLARDLRPVDDVERARTLQEQTTAMRSLIAGHTFADRSAVDTAEMTARAQRGAALNGEELRYIDAAQRAANATVKLVRESGGGHLAAMTEGHSTQSDLLAAIEKAIGEHGEVLDRASPALGRVRRSLAQAQADARERCQSIVRSSKFAKMIGEAIVTVREGRYVVPIKAEFAGEFPGIVHDTSSSGQTVFIEPLATLESNNRLRALRIEERHEIERIFAELAKLVGSRAAAIERNVDILAELDLVYAKAALSDAMDALEPEQPSEPRIAITRGRHPLLGGRAVPQTIALDAQRRVLIISGPNMGGKTVALKMVGLFVVLARCGLHVPAQAPTVIGAIRHIFADIGDQQSIADNLSTFAAHLRSLAAILHEADCSSLVLVDEIGGGTEPSAGAALATAILESLLRRGTLVIVTTHATELKLFAHGAEGVLNASVRFHPQTHAPTYELEIGAPGQSLAFDLARVEGIDAGILERAQTLLSEGAQTYETALADLAQAREETSAARAALEAERARFQAERNRVAEEAQHLERERERFTAAAAERLDTSLREFRRELERRAQQAGQRARPTAAQSELLGSVLDTLHADLGIGARRAHAMDARDGAAPSVMGIGSRVFVRTLGVDAEIIEDLGANVLVAAGALKTLVPRKELEVARSPGKAPARARTDIDRSVPRGGSASLDVRGKRFSEAEPLVEQWIDAALQHGPSTLRLIHGKGTGLLGRSLQDALKVHPGVGALRYGNEDEGGSGVTILELRSPS